MPRGDNSVFGPSSAPVFDPVPVRGKRVVYRAGYRAFDLPPFHISGAIAALFQRPAYPVRTAVTILSGWVTVRSTGGTSVDFDILVNGVTVSTHTVSASGLTLFTESIPLEPGDVVTVGVTDVYTGALEDFLVVLRVALVAVCFEPITYEYTSSLQSFTVPAGVTLIRCELHGARGASSYGVSQVGGNGGMVTGTFPVTPGEIYDVYVGGVGVHPLGGFPNGGNGTNAGVGGAGGGGRSEVRLQGESITNTMLIAAGGGGSGSGDVSGGAGGDGRYLVGEDAQYTSTGGTGSAGGVGASATGLGDGGQGYGGAGTTYADDPTFVGSTTTVGGGGGDGWFGGGAGAYGFGAVGGGGGSGHAGTGVTDIVYDDGTNTGDGLVIISCLG